MNPLLRSFLIGWKCRQWQNSPTKNNVTRVQSQAASSVVFTEGQGDEHEPGFSSTYAEWFGRLLEKALDELQPGQYLHPHTHTQRQSIVRL